MRRFLVLVALAVCLGAAPAFADDAPPPPLLPPGVSGPTPTVHATPTSGPTYVITPGSPGSRLPAPVTALPSEIKARPTPSAPSRPATPHPTPTAFATEVAAPLVATPAASSTNGADLWWMIGAAGLLVLVLSEFARLKLRPRLPKDP